MISDITDANVYHFAPVMEGHELVYIGDRKVLNKISLVINDDDIIAQTGMFPEFCILMTRISRDTCEKLVSNAVEELKQDFDNVQAKNDKPEASKKN